MIDNRAVAGPMTL